MCEQFPVWQAAWDALKEACPQSDLLRWEEYVRDGTPVNCSRGVGVVSPETYKRLLEQELAGSEFVSGC